MSSINWLIHYLAHLNQTYENNFYIPEERLKHIDAFYVWDYKYTQNTYAREMEKVLEDIKQMIIERKNW